MEKFLALLDNLLQHATFKRVGAVSLLLFVFIAALAVYENRNRVYGSVISRTEGDYVLEPPTDAGKAIVHNFAAKYPNIKMITLIDADPIGNRRIVVHRDFHDITLERIVRARTDIDPHIGDGVLFSANEQNNKEVLAVMAGEFLCTPNGPSTAISRAYPGSELLVTYGCRVPLPPAFNKATGWFTIHVDKWPLDNIEQLKVDALSMSLNYYNTEILRQGPVK